MRHLIKLLPLLILSACASNPAAIKQQQTNAAKWLNGQHSHVDLYVTKDGVAHYGSGVVIEQGGEKFILTCAHVVPADWGDAQMGVGHSPRAFYMGALEIIKHNPERDLALIRIAHNLQHVEAATLAAKKPVLGDVVVVHGNPNGQCNITTFGRVGSVRGSVIVTDAAVMGGNSGGGMYHNGELVGIVKEGFQHGLSIATDIEHIRTFLND